MSSQENEAGTITIDGAKYTIPTVDSFDIDEAMILYDNCGLTLEDFAIDPEDIEQLMELQQRIKHPGFMRTLVQVAYQRGNPTVSPAKARAVAGKANVLKIFEEFAEADARPPEMTPVRQQSSSENSPPSTPSSGPGSSSDLDELDAQLASIGTSV